MFKGGHLYPFEHYRGIQLGSSDLEIYHRKGLPPHAFFKWCSKEDICSFLPCREVFIFFLMKKYSAKLFDSIIFKRIHIRRESGGLPPEAKRYFSTYFQYPLSILPVVYDYPSTSNIFPVKLPLSIFQFQYTPTTSHFDMLQVTSEYPPTSKSSPLPQ